MLSEIALSGLWGACVAAAFLLLLHVQLRALLRRAREGARPSSGWQRSLRVGATGLALLAPALVHPPLVAIAVFSFSLARLWLVHHYVVGHGS